MQILLTIKIAREWKFSPKDVLGYCIKQRVILLCICQYQYKSEYTMTGRKVLQPPLWLDFSTSVENHTVYKTKTYYKNVSYN